MPASPASRRLCLLVDAGGTPCLVDALSVRQVDHPDADGESVHGFLELRDVAQLLGGAPEERPGLAVVLDLPVGFALRVRAVRGVVDLGGAELQRLPDGVSRALSCAARGVWGIGGELAVELDVPSLEGLLGEESARSTAAAVPAVSEGSPGRALMFREGGRAWCVPLAEVVQVVSGTSRFAPLPGRCAGLLEHAGAIWPVFASSPRATAPLSAGSSVVLMEAGGRSLGLLADEVVGIHDGLRPGTRPGAWCLGESAEEFLRLDPGPLFP